MTTPKAAKDAPDDEFLNLIAEGQHDSAFVREHD